MKSDYKMKKIEKFVDDVIEREDYVFLDILWTFRWCIFDTDKSGYWEKNKKEEVSKAFRELFYIVCRRNLQKKYNLKEEEINKKMMSFANFLKDFSTYETYDEDKGTFASILTKTSEILIQNVKSRIQNLSDLGKKILSFVLHYIPTEIKEKDWGEMIYFDTSDSEELTYTFNLLFNEELKKYRFKAESYRGYIGSGESERHGFFWQLWDELVKIGIGYWCVEVTSSMITKIYFIIPNFIYEAIKDYKNKLPVIENFEEKINEIKKEKEAKRLKKEWTFKDFEETDVVSEVLESEIETSIISNPEILEEGLELVGNQYPTSVGYIDILCKDKNGAFVVVELKRGAGSYEVVGQIQKYMAWVSENLAKDKQVRGIIVVKEYDKELEYAVKGSKFPIEIKIFGQEPPTMENIKYCTRCGKPNPKSAKYCIKCGQEFWM